MNADLEAAIAEGRRRMRQFEEKTSQQIDQFDKEVDNHHHILGHKYSSVREDLKPVSAPLWGVILETSSGHRIYKDHVPFDLVQKCPRHCACTSHPSPSLSSSTTSSYTPLPASYVPSSYQSPSSSYAIPDPPIEEPTIDSILSVESKTIMEGRRWGLNKYVYDDDYVSNAPYGIIMRKPTPKPALIQEDSGEGLMARQQPNTKLVSQYWRRKWKIPKDWWKYYIYFVLLITIEYFVFKW